MQEANRVAVITGASTGIGESLAREFVARGGRAVLAARSEEKLRALAAEMGEERALALPTDVSHPDQCDRLVARAAERFGRLDLLVNNAGLGLYSRMPEMDWEHFRRMWEVNYFAAVRLTLAALPLLRASRGAVVNISSVAGKLPLPYMGAYCATKAALNTFSSGLRMDLAGSGVRVIVICPGRVRTEFHKSAYRDGQQLPAILKKRESYRGISPEKVARATLRAWRRGRREVVLPWPLRLLVGVRAVLPRLTDRVLVRVFQRAG